jgi:stage II sporulation protein D
MAAFHSNCGGETASAAEAWVTELPYLKKITDPYCLTERNAEWSTTIPAATWKLFLSKSGYIGNVNDPVLLTFSQHGGRKPFFEPTDSIKVPVTVIRTEFALRSSFFSFEPAGQIITVKGRGYGHGVGLCQEGAMVMAKNGRTCEEIISFYYSGVQMMMIKDARLPPPVY